MEFLQWLYDQPLAAWVRDSDYGYAFVISSHAIGMAIVVGVVLMFSFRVLGLGQGVTVEWFARLKALAWTGFVINAISGVVLYMTDPVLYTFSIPFICKMALIVAGGIAIWQLGRAVAGQTAAVAAGGASPRIRQIALSSATFWIGAIVAGRLIAYVGQ